MLINPYKVNLANIPGTRILADDLGLAGFRYPCTRNPKRIWTLQYLFAPITRRSLGGVRAKFVDNKDFVTFCNQRDLEVILGIANPGDYCPWTKTAYPGPEDRDWYGFCMDDEDLTDDLHDRELRLREIYTSVLPDNLEIVRRVHSDSLDREELFVILCDYDFTTGIGPDVRFETIKRRWALADKTKMAWEYVDL
jgi:hypothetical protein